MDPEFVDFLATFPPLNFADPAAQRLADAQAPRPESRLPAGVTRTDEEIPGVDGHQVPIAVYRDEDVGPDGGIVVWIHGGGFVLGDPELEESFCALLARKLSTVVVAVTYRFAPEHPYPAGLDDCYCAVTHLAALSGVRYPSGPLIVAGASAGAALAAGVVLRSRDSQGPGIDGQVLLMPFIDATLSQPSIRTLAEAPVFDSRDARLCWNHYLGPLAADPPDYASPAVAADLTGLPPAYILAAGEDCLRDEAIDYALRLQDSGVLTELHLVPSVPHGFNGLLPGATASRRARHNLEEAMAAMLGRTVRVANHAR
ncbi:alpha/beta hydrolase [Nocardia jiangxiensis]|uniref:Alpha/beta hydrolase n=1 Tax=Nocardia jiangxiensis TaxID=282685 RepID=A0ABW6S1Z1_9NOCA